MKKRIKTSKIEESYEKVFDSFVDRQNGCDLYTLMLRCNSCGLENDVDTRYCQGCGSRIKPRKNMKMFLRKLSTLNFDSLAGAGSKGVSFAPILTQNLLGVTKNREKSKVKVVLKKDKSWFCPDCGQNNKPYSLFCQQCGREV